MHYGMEGPCTDLKGILSTHGPLSVTQVMPWAFGNSASWRWLIQISHILGIPSAPRGRTVSSPRHYLYHQKNSARQCYPALYLNVDKQIPKIVNRMVYKPLNCVPDELLMWAFNQSSQAWDDSKAWVGLYQCGGGSSLMIKSIPLEQCIVLTWGNYTGPREPSIFYCKRAFL